MKARLANKVIRAIILPDGEPSGKVYRDSTFHAACRRLRMWREEAPGDLVREDALDVALRLTEAKAVRHNRRRA